MPEIDRDKLKSKLDSIPESDREPYLQALKSKGYTWSVSPQQKETPGVLSQTANLLSGGEMGQEPSPEDNPKFRVAREAISNTRIMRALDAMATAGKYGVKKTAEGADYLAEKAGQASSPLERAGYNTAASALRGIGAGIGTVGYTAAKFLAPQDRLSALGTIVGLTPGESAEAKAAYNAPTKAQRAIAEVMSVQSNVKPEHIAAVIANPEIMSDATPTMREVGKEYQAVFDELGMKFDGKTYKEITGMRYPPNETQAARLKDIVATASEKLENMKSAEAAGKPLDPKEALTAAEAFLARSAGKKVLTGTADAATKRLVSQDVGAMDNFLENNGIPQVKALGHKYFQAAAKESLSEAIPKLRNGKPAVVRSMIMSHYGKEAALALAEGRPVKAAVNAATGAAMSPWVQGKAIPFLAGPTNPILSRAAVMGIKPSNLQALQDYNGQ